MFLPSDSDSDEALAPEKDETPVPAGSGWGFDDDDDFDDDGRQQMMSPEEKFNQDLQASVDRLRAASDQNQWSKAWEAFEELKKILKSKKNKKFLLLKGVPTHYLIYFNQFLEGLEAAVKSEKDKEKDDDETFKGMENKKNVIRAFKRFENQVLKKKDYPFVKQLEEYRKKNDIWAQPEEEEDDLEDKDEDVDDMNWDDDDFGFDDDDGDVSISGDDNDEPSPVMRKITKYDREFWLKPEYQPEWMKASQKKKKSKKKEKDIEKGEKRIEVEKTVEKKVVWNDGRIRRDINKILQSKTSIDRQERRKQIEILRTLDERLKKSPRKQWSILVKLLLIHNLRDLYEPPRCLKRHYWIDVVKYTNELIDLLTENPHYRLHIRGLRKLELNEEEKQKEKEKQPDDKTGTSLMAFGLAEAEEMLQAEEYAQEEDEDKVEGLDDAFFWVHGNLHAICMRLRDNLILAFKKSAPKTEEYEHRLKDHSFLVELCYRCLVYSNQVTKHRMDALQFRHLLVKLTYEAYDLSWDKLRDGASADNAYMPFHIPNRGITHDEIAQLFDELREFTPEKFAELDEDDKEAVEKFTAEETEIRRRLNNFLSGLCIDNVKQIFRQLNEFNPEAFGAVNKYEEEDFTRRKEEIETEAVLCLVHHLALHHRYYLARDILTGSGYGKDQRIQQKDILIQILYNRSVARLAIAAFVHEDWSNSMSLLKNMYMTGKIKELLAQGVKSDLQWKYNKTQAEITQEQQERQRMVPEHTFINQDLLESVHFISSLFFEMRAILQAKGDDTRNKKGFRRAWDSRQKREFQAPPENTRDKIVEAGAQMKKGDWQKCVDQLEDLKCWEHFQYADEVKRRVYKRAKSECLRCYLISSCKHFSDIELDVLSQKFNMEVKNVVKLCSQFILNQDIRASIDIPGGFLVVEEPLPTLFEHSATRFHHKLASFYNTIKESGDALNVKQPNRDKFSNRKDNKPAGGSDGRVWKRKGE